MKLFNIFVMCAAGSVATTAAAETDLRLNGGFGLYENQTTNNQLNDLYVQGFWPLGSAVGAQLDLTSHEYDFDTSRRLSAGLHLSYTLSSQLTLGGYYGQQDWFGSDYNYYGIEAAYENDRFKGDGHIGQFEPHGGGAGYTLYGFDGSYLISDFGVGSSSADSGASSSGPSSSFGGRYYVIGGIHGILDPIHETLIYLGGSAELDDGLYVDLTAARVNDQNQIGFQFRKEIGDGVPFHRRGWTSAFKAW